MTQPNWHEHWDSWEKPTIVHGPIHMKLNPPLGWKTCENPEDDCRNDDNDPQYYYQEVWPEKEATRGWDEPTKPEEATDNQGW